jgi:hypothetical protein
MDKDDWWIVRQRFAFSAASLNGLSKTEVEGDLEGMRRVVGVSDVVNNTVYENVGLQTGMCYCVYVWYSYAGWTRGNDGATHADRSMSTAKRRRTDVICTRYMNPRRGNTQTL